MENQGKVIAGIAFLLGLIFLLWVVNAMYQESQGNNQIVRPNPNAPPAPVVPQLPGLISELRQAKSLCQGRGIEAKHFIRTHRVREARALQGQHLYTEAKAALDGCIDYLRAGLARRFNNDDSPQIDQKFRAANSKVKAFFSWVDGLERPKHGAAADPLDTARQLLPSWLEAVRKANDKAIEMLREDLNQCRLRDWNEIGN